MADKDLEHRKRLKEFFQTQDWDDLKSEIEQLLRNADMKVHSINCENRELYAGKHWGIREVLNLENQFRRE